VGRLREVPGVFSQGATLKELRESIADAYRMMLDTEPGPIHPEAKAVEVGLEV